MTTTKQHPATKKTPSQVRKRAVNKALDLALLNCVGEEDIDCYLRGIDTGDKNYDPDGSDIQFGARLKTPFHEDILTETGRLSALLGGDYSVEKIEAYVNEIRTRAAKVREWFQANPSVPPSQKGVEKSILMHILDNAPAIMAREDKSSCAWELAECHLQYGIKEAEVDAAIENKTYRWNEVGSR